MNPAPILEHIHKYPGATVQETATYLGRSRQHTQIAMKKLADEGVLLRARLAQRHHPYRYRLPGAPEPRRPRQPRPRVPQRVLTVDDGQRFYLTSVSGYPIDGEPSTNYWGTSAPCAFQVIDRHDNHRLLAEYDESHGKNRRARALTHVRRLNAGEEVA